MTESALHKTHSVSLSMLLFAALFVSCAGSKQILYEFSAPLDRHSDWADASGDGHTGDSLDLNGIGLTWKISSRSLGFVLNNYSPDTLEIAWENSVYIDPEGRGHTGMVLGFDVFAGMPPIPPSTRVLPDSSLERFMLPRDYVRYVKVRGIDTWIPISLFPSSEYKGAIERAQTYVGDTIGVILAVGRRGKYEGWHHKFEILSAELEMK